MECYRGVICAMIKKNLDSSFLEKLMIKAMLVDKRFLAICSSVFEPEYFDNSSASAIFKYTSDYLEEYNGIPEELSIINSTKDDDKREVKDFLSDVNSVDFNISKNYDFLFTQTNEYLKEQAVKRAILDSVNIIDEGSDVEAIREKIEHALSKDLKIDLGLKYFEDLGERLRRIFTASNIRMPTYFPVFDEFISGGFPPFTLSVLVARIHGFKSNLLANFAARQVLHGKNVVLMTLEMAQDAFAQRFDSIYSLSDINRMYMSDAYKIKLTKALKEVKATEGRGELFIKQFPTGDASVRDFKTYLRELLIRDIKPDILMCDYINLMKPAMKGNEGMYSSVKRIAEELRALSFEFEVPVLSVSQLNREGGFVGFEELSFNYIAESLGLPATADFMAIMGVDDDSLVYESELHGKIVKNRLGGRVGERFTMYYDSRTLKMWDESELNDWILAGEKSGDERNLFEPRNNGGRNNNRRN